MAAPLRSWVDLAPFWDMLEEAGKKRDAQKRGYKSTRLWTGSPSVTGLLGEQVYALVTDQSVDLTLRKSGDNGPDFPDGVDVKATPNWQAPELWLNAPLPSTGKKATVAAFALVALDMDGRRGALIGVVPRGWCARAPVTSTPNGDKHILTASQVIELDRRMRAVALGIRAERNDLVTRATENEAAQQRRSWATLEAHAGVHAFYPCADCENQVEYSAAAIALGKSGRILCGVCSVAERRAAGGGPIAMPDWGGNKPRPSAKKRGQTTDAVYLEAE